MSSVVDGVSKDAGDGLAERVGFNDGWCTTVFRQRMAVVKAELGMIDPADRLVFAPDEQFQCDLWFPGKVVGE